MEGRTSGLLAHVGEPRTDIEYWDTPLYQRVYLRILYAVCGACSTSMVMEWLHIDGTAQWVVGIIIGVYVLTFRWFRPNGFSKEIDLLAEDNDQAMKELQAGDYTGVPTFLVPKEDRERVRQERSGRTKSGKETTSRKQ